MHYPPLYGENTSPQILDVLARHSVRQRYYGHIHAAGCRWAFEGERRGIFFSLVSGDYLHFDPLLVEPGKKLLIFREIHNLSIGIDVPVCYNYKIVGL